MLSKHACKNVLRITNCSTKTKHFFHIECRYYAPGPTLAPLRCPTHLRGDTIRTTGRSTAEVPQGIIILLLYAEVQYCA